MIIGYIIAAILWLLVNATLYGSAFWAFWKGLKNKKLYWFVWPTILLLANIAILVGYRPHVMKKLKNIESGQILKSVDNKPIALTAYGTGGKCDPRCAELLLEGHIKYYTLSSPPQNKNQQHLTFEKAEGDCFTRPNYVSDLKSIDAFWGYCVQLTSDPMPTNYILASQWRDEDVLSLKTPGLKGQYWSGIALLDQSTTPADLLAIKGKGMYKAIAFPLSINLFKSGMEGSLRGKISLRTTKFTPSRSEYNSINLLDYRTSQTVNKEAYNLNIARQNDLIREVFHIDLNGKIDLPRESISVQEAGDLLREAFDAGTLGNGDRGFMESVPVFAHSYEGFPFTSLMKNYISTDFESTKQFPHIAADRYLNRYLRETNPSEFKRKIAARKKQLALEKAKRKAENERRFCEQESRRDGRDCSRYQTGDK